MKTLVNVSVPAISKDYDVLIPSFLTIKEIVPLIASAVEELSNNLYTSSGHEFLCSRERNILLNQDEVFENYGIEDGDHLFLI